jgi:ribosomal protein S27AE
MDDTTCDRCGEICSEHIDRLPGERVYCGQCWLIVSGQD